MRLRALVLALLLLVGVGFAALSLYWHWAAEEVAQAIALWTEEQRARGYEVSYNGPRIGGFPAHLSVRLGEPRLAAPGGWIWSGGAIAGEAAFWSPHMLRLDLPQHQELSMPWPRGRRDLELDAASARGLVTLDPGGWVERADVAMSQTVLRDQTGGALSIAELRYNVAQRPPGDDGVAEWTLLASGEADAIALPDGPDYPFGREIDRLAFDATLIGRAPRGDPAAALARWRDEGGLVEVDSLDLRWGPLDLRAEGTAALDAELRPQGAFTARISGLAEAVDALVASGVVEPNAAVAIKFGVLALAQGRDADGRPIVELPITVQDGLFYLGPVALFPVGPVLADRTYPPDAPR